MTVTGIESATKHSSTLTPSILQGLIFFLVFSDKSDGNAQKVVLLSFQTGYRPLLRRS